MCKLLTCIAKCLKETNTEEEKPVMEKDVIHANDILRIFREHNIIWACDPKYSLEDMWFHYLKEPEAFMEIYYDFASVAPPYKSNTKEDAGYDCDDFASCLPAWVKLFSPKITGQRINAVWEVWGETPEGPHGWTIFMNKHGMYETEPQQGFVWPLGANPSYKAVIAK